MCGLHPFLLPHHHEQGTTMRHHTKATLTTLIATILLAAAVSGTATARVFSFSNWNFRVVWTSLEFTQRPLNFGTALCSVTLEGSFHSQTMSKVEKALIGYVSRASVVNGCVGGRVTINQESLPWHITYNGFRGTLPNITSIRVLLNNVAYEVKSNLLLRTCRVRLEAGHSGKGEVLINAAGEATEDRPDPAVRIPVTGCEIAEGEYTSRAGDGLVARLGTTTRIRITLI
jgi:hypothetical protein